MDDWVCGYGGLEVAFEGVSAFGYDFAFNVFLGFDYCKFLCVNVEMVYVYLLEIVLEVV